MTIRLQIVFLFIIGIVITLLTRVYFLSIKSNTYYEQLSKNNYIKKIYTTSPRGMIEDRNGEKIAINEIGFSISIKPHIYSKKEKEKLNKTLDKIVEFFPDFKKEKLLKVYNKKNSFYEHDFITIIDYIPHKEFFPKYTILASEELIKIDPSSRRYYPYNEVASHILGHVGKASRREMKNNLISSHNRYIGKSGLEKFYNHKLEGTLGYKNVKVNAYNKELKVLEEIKPSIYNNIKLSIDIKLQKYVQSLFKDISGSIIVMNANTGEILVGASLPEFNNNIFVNGISKDKWNEIRNNFNHPFTNKLVNGLYPPGSTIKMGVALSFLENGISEYAREYCSGSLEIGNRKFRCWKSWGHGSVGFAKALRESCDDFFYKGSLKVGINKISKTLDKFGIGKKTGVDQTNEFIGINPNKNWKIKKYKQPWYIGETVITSIGQGNMLVTPMQLTRFTAGIATGKLPTPYFFKENYKEPTPININKKYFDVVRNGMYEVANHIKGTAHRYIHSKITIAAKTGTAQVVSIPQSEKKRMKESELEYFKRSHAWLTTYGPYENPQFVITAIIEHGGHGGKIGILISKIYDKLLELGYIKK